MKENLELEYHSSFEMHIESTIRYAGLIGADRHFPFLKKVGYAGLIFNLYMLLLVYFSKDEITIKGILYIGAGSLFSLYLIFYRRFWIRGIESVVKKSEWEPEPGNLTVKPEGMFSSSKTHSVNFVWENLKEIIYEPGKVVFYFEKIGLFTFREQYFSDFSAMKEFMIEIQEFLPEGKRHMMVPDRILPSVNKK